MPQAALGIALGLALMAALAVTAGSRHGASVPPGSRAIFASGMTYVVLFLPLFTIGGLDLAALIAFTVFICIPVGAAAWMSRYGRAGEWGLALRIGAGATAVGLIAALLIAAGQTLSLLGRVNPFAVMITLTVVTVLVAIANGVRGTARAGRWLFWVLVAVMAVVLAAGLYLGRPGDLIAPILPVDPPSLGALGAIGVALVALGCMDPAMRRYVAPSTSRARIVAVVLIATVTALGLLAMMLILGGSLVAPSLPFFVIPANLGMVPGALAVAMLVISFLMATTIASLLAAPADPVDTSIEKQSASGRRLTTIAVVASLALVIALASPSMQDVLLLTALVAAATTATTLVTSFIPGERPATSAWSGLLAGLIVAVVAVGVMTATGTRGFDGAGLLALLATAAASAGATAVTVRRSDGVSGTMGDAEDFG